MPLSPKVSHILKDVDWNCHIYRGGRRKPENGDMEKQPTPIAQQPLCLLPYRWNFLRSRDEIDKTSFVTNNVIDRGALATQSPAKLMNYSIRQLKSDIFLKIERIFWKQRRNASKQVVDLHKAAGFAKVFDLFCQKQWHVSCHFTKCDVITWLYFLQNASAENKKNERTIN